MEIGQIIEALFAAIGVACIIGAIVYYSYNEIKKSKVNKENMLLFADIPLSMKNDALYINLVNVDKYPEVWESHEADLDIFGMGMLLPSTFHRTPDVPNGFKIEHIKLSNKEILSMMAALKYNKFEVSIDGGSTRYKVISVNDNVAKRLTSKLQEANSKMDSGKRDKEIQKIVNQVKKKSGESSLNSYNFITQIDEENSTKTTMKITAVVPNDSNVLEGVDYKKDIKFYYTYNGKLYEFETTDMTKHQNVYEWKIINLSPGSIYVGLAYSLDGGNTLLPTTSLYGITRDDDNNVLEVSTASLGKPSEDKLDQGKPIFTYEEAIKIISKTLMKKKCDIVVKTHYEDKYPDDFVPLARVDEFYSEFDWVPCVD